VSYEGKTVAELDAAFREAVDDYLATCLALGQTPENHARVHSTCGSGMTFIWPQPWKLHARR